MWWVVVFFDYASAPNLEVFINIQHSEIAFFMNQDGNEIKGHNIVISCVNAHSYPVLIPSLVNQRKRLSPNTELVYIVEYFKLINDFFSSLFPIFLLSLLSRLLLGHCSYGCDRSSPCDPRLFLPSTCH